MNFNELSDEEKEKYEKMAKEPFWNYFYYLIQTTNKGKCMFCGFDLNKKVLSFKKNFVWDGEYLAHIHQTHGLQPDDFNAIVKEVLLEVLPEK